MLTPFLRVEDDPSLVRLGSAQCGWWVPSDVVRPGAVAYCAGAGEDISFDLELHGRGMHVVTIDPTPRAVAHVATVDPGDDRFVFVQMGLWHEPAELTFFAPTDASDVSHSVLNLQRTDAADAFTAQVDTIESIMATQGHAHVELLKVDIEGSERELFADCHSWITSVRQLIVECHQGYTATDLLADCRRGGAEFRAVHVDRKPEWGYEVVTAERAG